MEKAMNMERRDFLKGAAAGALGLGMLGIVSGCAPQAAPESDEANQGQEQGSVYANADIVETIDADIVVVGSGFAGLAAAVAAGEEGLNAVCLEAAPSVGGFSLVEGTFAIDSPYQKEQGIVYTSAEIVNMELKASQWRADGLLWKEFVDASGANLQWLIDQGVEFTGEVEAYGYGPNAGMVTFHWFKDHVMTSGYNPQMQAKAESYGVEFRTSTRGMELIMADGAVAGLYAEGPAGVIQINAKAVVLATGSVNNNFDLVKQMGFNLDRMICVGSTYNNGDGHEMAVKVGGKSALANATFNCGNSCLAMTINCIHPINGGNPGMGKGGEFLWLNEDCKRFINEAFTDENFQLQAPPTWNQNEHYGLFTQKSFDKWVENCGFDLAESQAVLEEGLAKNEPMTMVRADTIEELAAYFGKDPVALKEAVDRYNGFCATGIDEDFGKPAASLWPVDEAPYYMVSYVNVLEFVTGALTTNRKFQVMTEGREPIPGLWAIGNDGMMLYRNIYPIDVPGTNSAHCVYGARSVAAQVKQYV